MPARRTKISVSSLGSFCPRRAAGAVRNVGGKIEEDVGRLTGDIASQFKASFEDVIHQTIEDKTYTAVAVAIALGWLVGRMHYSVIEPLLLERRVAIPMGASAIGRYPMQACRDCHLGRSADR